MSKRSSTTLKLCLALAAGAVPATGQAVVLLAATSATRPPTADPPRQAVRTQSPSGVPEPGVWALIAAGFTVAGLAIRRRASAPVVAS